MSLSVKSLHFSGSWEVCQDPENAGVYIHNSMSTIYGLLVYRNVPYAYEFTIYPGYRGNCASSPDIDFVQKLVPSYVSDDPKYDQTFDFHDWAYSVKGSVCKGFKFTRAEVDDFARSAMRETPTLQNSKWARFRAGIMRVAVRLFAWTKSHWGNDSYDSKKFATFSMTELPC